MPFVKIGERLVGESYSPFIIAEAGINHNGETEKAFEMIKLAKNAGADAVKFQTFRAEEFIGDPDLQYTYKSQGKEVTESILEMFKRYEFSRDEWFSIKKKCDEEEILFLSTPQNRSDLDLLLEISISAIKVGSDDFTNLSLLKSYSETDLPMIISCGMSDMGEIYQSLETIGSLDGYPTVLLLCTSEYPTPPEDVNLLRLKTLSDAFPMIVTGFSDHTQGPLASSLALALGASVFEKHFTSDHELPGPDHWFSEDPDGLAEWIQSIKASHTMLGSSVVRPTEQEKINKREYQRVIIAGREIHAGEELTPENLVMKRMPADTQAFPANLINHIINKKAGRDYKKGEPI